MDGEYQTRDGRAVRILTTDVQGSCPVVAVVNDMGSESIQRYTEDGHCSEVGLDIIPLVTTHKGWCVVRNNIRWVGSTVVRNTPGAAWEDKELEDKENPREEHRVAQVFWKD